jgi:hypothetical protein
VKSTIEFRFRRCRTSGGEQWWWWRTDSGGEWTVLGYMGRWNEHLEDTCGISGKTLDAEVQGINGRRMWMTLLHKQSRL